MKFLMLRHLLWIAGLVIFTSVSASPLVSAQRTGPMVSAEPGISQDEANRRYFKDLEVITHEGEKVRFYSYLLKDKLVVINFFYVNCPTAPPGTAKLFRLRNLLADRLGKEVLLVSISVDPERDTLEVVQECARKFNPKKGWIFVTGDRENMDVINRKLGNTLRLPEGHLRLFLLGNLKAGNWMKMLESAPASSIADGLQRLAAEMPS